MSHNRRVGKGELMTNSYIIATSNLHFEKPVGRGCSYYIARMMRNGPSNTYDDYNFILLMDEDYDFRVLERLQKLDDYIKSIDAVILIAGERKGSITVVLANCCNPSEEISKKVNHIIANGREGDEWSVNVYFGHSFTEIYDDRLSMLAHPQMPKKVYDILIEKVKAND